MPTYTVEIDGKRYQIQGDREPTEAEARAAVGAYQPPPEKSLGGLANNAISDVIPAAKALGEGIVNTGYLAGRTVQGLLGDTGAQQELYQGTKRAVGGLLTKGKEALTNPKATAQSALDAAYEHPVQAAIVAEPFIPGGGLLTRGAGLAGKAMRWAAPQAMDMGLTRTMADRLEFPGSPQRLVDEGIVPNQARVQGALSNAEDNVNFRARINPHPVVDPNDIATKASAYAVDKGKVPGLGNLPGPEDQEIADLAQGYLQRNTRPRTLSETVEQKRAYQARGNYNNRPNAPVQTNEQTNFNQGVAAANRGELERLDPKIASELSREEDLLGALTALENRDAKAIPLSTVGTLKSAVGLRNPTMMGTAAIGLDRTGRALQTITPEMVRAALANLLVSHAQEQ